MLARNLIARIHIEANNSGLKKEDYHKLLFRVANVESSTQLSERQADAVISAIKSEAEKRNGWKPRQCQLWRKYLKMAGMNEQAGGELLYKITGYMSPESPELVQTDYDQSMVEIESVLEDRIESAQVAMPGDVDLRFWRSRNPRNGTANRREVRKIKELWDELCGYLEPCNQNLDYLFGFCAHTLRLNRAKPVEELKELEAHKVIEALKQRIAQEKKKLSTEVPF